MTITIDNFQDYRVPVIIGTHTINFFAFNGLPLDLTALRINDLMPVFSRMPPVHLPGIGPIFLLIGRPLSDSEHASGGGTYPDVRRLLAQRDGVNAQRAASWGASYEVIAEAVRVFGRFGGVDRGLHVIPLADWQQAGYASTVVHECAHGVDTFFNLHRRAGRDPLRPGAVLPMTVFPADLPGQFCGHGRGDNVNRRAVNAYCSMITGFPNVRTATRRQIMAAFQASNAFNAVSARWWAAQFPGLTPDDSRLR